MMKTIAKSSMNQYGGRSIAKSLMGHYGGEGWGGSYFKTNNESEWSEAISKPLINQHGEKLQRNP